MLRQEPWFHDLLRLLEVESRLDFSMVRSVFGGIDWKLYAIFRQRRRYEDQSIVLSPCPESYWSFLVVTGCQVRHLV